METIDLLLSQAAKGRSPRRAHTPCPDLELLADYAAGRVPDAQREALEAHLADCTLCLELVLLSEQLTDPDPLPVPNRVLEPVLAMVSDPVSAWKAALKLLASGLQLLTTTGERLEAAPLAMRRQTLGVEAGDVEEHITLRQGLKEFHAQVSVAREEARRVALTVSLQSETTLPPFKVELWAGDRLRGVKNDVSGAVRFSAVQSGEYRLVVMARGETLGELHLSLLE